MPIRQSLSQLTVNNCFIINLHILNFVYKFWKTSWGIYFCEFLYTELEKNSDSQFNFSVGNVS